MIKWIFGLVIFFWIGLQSSQSGIDLMDFLLVMTSLWVAYKTKDLKNLFQGFKPAWLWLVWLPVVALGFVFGAPVELKVALGVFSEFKWILSFLCYIYLFKKLAWDDRQIRWLAVIFILMCIAGSIASYMHIERDSRVGGLIGHSMPFAHMVGPCALLLLFYGLNKFMDKTQKPGWRAVYLIAPLFGSLLLILSMTRGVWVGYVVALLICAGIYNWKAMALSALTIVVAVGVMVAGSHRLQERLTNKTNAETQSNDERLWFWKENIKIFRDYPIFGIGYSQNNVHVEEYLKRDGIDWIGGNHAHNQYIHFLAGTGAAGLICFLIFLGAIFTKVGLQVWELRKKKIFSDYFFLLLGAFSGMICFSVGALTESNFSISKNRSVFLFIVAIAYAVCAKLKSSPTDQK